MSIVRDGFDERQTRVGRMIDEFRTAQSRRFAKATSVKEQGTPHVPGEYRALYTYLEHRYASIVVLTFEQIDSLLGFPLPTPARNDREWWTDTVDSPRHSAAWTAAGRTAAPNLSAGTIAFERPV